jgi:hypothetical protein
LPAVPATSTTLQPVMLSKLLEKIVVPPPPVVTVPVTVKLPAA